MSTRHEPIDIATLLPAEGQPGGLLADDEVDAAIAAVLRCWLAEDEA